MIAGAFTEEAAIAHLGVGGRLFTSIRSESTRVALLCFVITFFNTPMDVFDWDDSNNGGENNLDQEE